MCLLIQISASLHKVGEILSLFSVLDLGMWLEKAVLPFRAIVVVFTIGLVGVTLALTLPILGERSDISNRARKIAILAFLGSVLILVTLDAYMFYYLWRLILQFCQDTKKKAMSFDPRKTRVLKGAIMAVIGLAVVYALVFCTMFYLFGAIAVNEAIPLEIFIVSFITFLLLFIFKQCKVLILRPQPKLKLKPNSKKKECSKKKKEVKEEEVAEIQVTNDGFA